MPKRDEEKRRKEAEARAMEVALNEELLKRRMDEEALPLKKRQKDLSEAKFTPSFKAHGKDWKKIVEEYSKQYPQGPDKEGALVFPTMDDAVKFFTTQAKAGLRFFATQYENGAPIDFHVYSCGDKHLYQGTYAEIKAQLEAACKKDPDNTMTRDGLKEFLTCMPQPLASRATDMREQIKGHRQSTEAEERADVSSAPNATTRR